MEERLVECVPNFSEGRNKEVIDKILEKILSVPGIYILGNEMDPDHNRAVVTFVGSPESVVEAAFRSIEEAAKLIDLNKHKGEHPRMGAADVCPFIPLKNVTMEECVELAHKLGKRVGDELQIPVYLYENAATRPERKNLAKIRKGQFEKLKELIGKDPKRDPDYGPNHIHPTAGAIAIGARFFLIAYNVNLNTTDLKLAKKIAKSIREKDGGFPCVKAMGFALEERNMVQVSMNLTDYRKTSMKTVFDEITKQAKESNVEVVESEIVGLIPLEALENITKETLKLTGFKSEQIIENKLQKAQSDPFISCKRFIDVLSSSKPTPGGGSVSALAGTLGASLGNMVYNLTEKSKKYNNLISDIKEVKEKLNNIQNHLFHLIKEDSEAYESYVKARKMKKDTPEEKAEREKALENAMMKSILVPLDTLKSCVKVLELLEKLVNKSNPNAISDIGVASYMCISGVEGALLNIKINISSLKDEKLKQEINNESKELVIKAREIHKKIVDIVESKI